MNEITNTASEFFDIEDAIITNKDYMKPIRVADFNTKNEILKKNYREATAESLNIDLFERDDSSPNRISSA